jgi:carbonic anhydrase
MQSLDSKAMLSKMRERGISEEKINLIKYCGIDFDHWMNGFTCPEESVKSTVDIILNHPLIPKDIQVYGLIMDPLTGKIDRL